jgi:hypothetical protein
MPAWRAIDRTGAIWNLGDAEVRGWPALRRNDRTLGDRRRHERRNLSRLHRARLGSHAQPRRYRRDGQSQGPQGRRDQGSDRGRWCRFAISARQRHFRRGARGGCGAPIPDPAIAQRMPLYSRPSHSPGASLANVFGGHRNWHPPCGHDRVYLCSRVPFTSIALAFVVIGFAILCVVGSPLVPARQAAATAADQPLAFQSACIAPLSAASWWIFSCCCGLR